MIAFFVTLRLSHVALASAEVSDATLRINKLLDNPPASETLELVYKKVEGLAASVSLFRWSIKDTPFGVDLYPVASYPMKELEISSKYEVKGVVLGEDYGTVHIWVREIHKY